MTRTVDFVARTPIDEAELIATAVFEHRPESRVWSGLVSMALTFISLAVRRRYGKLPSPVTLALTGSHLLVLHDDGSREAARFPRPVSIRRGRRRPGEVDLTLGGRRYWLKGSDVSRAEELISHLP